MVIAILNSGKEHPLPATFHPISFLSCAYQLLEQLTLQRIMPMVEQALNDDQAGFRPNRSSCNQILALTAYVEDGVQQKEKTGAVLT